MIVKCDNCQTRFKIPDEKVSEKGTRVRCTRCQNTFRVSRPALTVPSDPFAQFASSPRVEAPLPQMDFGATAPVRADGFFGSGLAAAPAPPGLLPDIPDFGEVNADHGSLLPAAPQNASRRSATLEVPAPPPAAPPSQVTKAIDPPAPPHPASNPEAPRSEGGTAPRAEAGTASRVGPGAASRGLGLAANVLVASALLAVLLWVGTVYLHEGKFDLSSLSWESFKALFSGPGELLAVDVSNGLYETSGGKPVFYVRGEVENRGSSVKRARVSVEILDGSLPLTRADVLAGASPNAEELYGIASAADLSALNAQLEKASTEVRPGSRVPFLVAFYEYPPDLSQYRLRVTVRDARDNAK